MPHQPEPSLPVQYLLSVSGPTQLLADFVDKAAHPSDPGKLFQPSRAAPVPQGLGDVDPLSLAYYLVIERKYEDAIGILDELNEDDALIEILRSPTLRSAKLSGHLAGKADMEAMRGVKVIRDNMRRFNALAPDQWALRARGTFTDHLRCCDRSQVDAECVEYRFSWHVLDLAILEELARQNPALTFGLVVVDSVAGSQAWAKYCQASLNFQGSRAPIDTGIPNWLEQLPVAFI